MKIKKFLLIAILLLASFLRLWKLSVNPVSLFGDELDLGYQAYSILKTGQDYYGNFMPIHFHSLAEWRTPLYLYSAVPTVAIWGITPLGVRFPAAIFGILGVAAMYFFVKELLIYKGQKNNFQTKSLLAALVLAISPWHLQYSRAGFEATQMLFFLLMGLWLLFRSLNNKNGKYLWLSVFCLVLTPWIYSTAKLFTPLLLVFVFIVFRKEILSFDKKHLIRAVISGLVVGLPIVVSTVFGGGTQRFSYINVFSDPTAIGEVGEARLQDARMRGTAIVGTTPVFLDRMFHNKFTFWGSTIVRNLLQPFSAEFLFIKGDPNLRQSIGIGEFYKIDAIILLMGLILFMTKYPNPKIKLFIFFWLIAGVIPEAITRDGGNHATRLILILPPLVFLISYGISETYLLLTSKYKIIFVCLYTMLLAVGFVSYQHNYWIHYPNASERWWHSGFKESFDFIKSIEGNYNKVYFSMQGEPIWIFFAGYYQYPPQKWHEGFPFENVWVEGFGRISFIDKYYFGSPNDGASIYDLPKFITNKDIYLAVAKEVAPNLIMDPGSVPNGLRLLKAIPYPSGEPAYYIFTKN